MHSDIDGSFYDSFWHRVILKVRQEYLKKYKQDNYGSSKLILISFEYANKTLSDAILGDKPFLFGRFGTTELGTLVNYLGIKSSKRNYIKLIRGEIQPWWWMRGVRKNMFEASGFFPPTDENLCRFSEMMLEDMKGLDILASIKMEENFFQNRFPKAKRLRFNSVEPFFALNPWTHALKGKNILVVHPMTDSIKKQWSIIDKVWPDGMMPAFNLKTFKAVQSIAGEKSEFQSWFDALEYMKSEISKIDFDICIIGCGAYGFPLAAHVKRMGKKALHFGGVTQLFFGIRGKRWESDPYFPFTNFMNEYWIRPNENETPGNAGIVEGGCYW